MNNDSIEGISLKLSSPVKKTMKNDSMMIKSSASRFEKSHNQFDNSVSVLMDKMAARKKEPVTF